MFTTEEVAEYFLRMVWYFLRLFPTFLFPPSSLAQTNPPPTTISVGVACARTPAIPLPEDTELTMGDGDDYVSIVSSMGSYEVGSSERDDARMTCVMLV